MKKRAEIKHRKGTYYISSISEATTGLLVSSTPYLVLADDCNTKELGLTILKALDGSRTGEPHPTDFKLFTSNIAKAFGLKSYRLLEDKFAQCCHISKENGVIEIQPGINAGSGRGFSFPSKLYFKLTESSSAERIGEGVLEGFRKCKYEEDEDL